MLLLVFNSESDGGLVYRFNYEQVSVKSTRLGHDNVKKEKNIFAVNELIRISELMEDL